MVVGLGSILFVLSGKNVRKNMAATDDVILVVLALGVVVVVKVSECCFVVLSAVSRILIVTWITMPRSCFFSITNHWR